MRCQNHTHDRTINKFLFSLLFAVVLLLVGPSVYSGSYDILKYGSKSDVEGTSNYTLQLTDPMPSYLFNGGKVLYLDYVEDISWQVRLVYGRQGHTDLDGGSSWDYEVTYDIKDGSGTTIHSGEKLYIEYGSSGSEVLEALNVYDDVTTSKASIVVTSTSITGTLPDDIQLELILHTERYERPDAEDVIAIDSRFEDDEIWVYWQYLDGAEEFDLEWVFIDEDDLDYSDYEVSSGTTTKDPFGYKEAVRVRTSDNHYKIEEAYPKGTLFFRVRAVSRFIDNGPADYSHFHYGSWYGDDASGDIAHYEFTTDFEGDKTWRLSKVYTEEGKNKKILSYYDETSRVRQSITNLNTDNLLVVGESKYDYEGRPVLSILPTPVNSRDLGFRSDFSQVSGGAVLRKDDFDQGSTPAALTDNSGAGEYYSDQLPFSDFAHSQNLSYIPDAGGYPYTQVRYKRDQTGRAERQGGLGADHQLYQSDEKAMRYYYGTANSTMLHRLFGSNVGDASHYKEIITEDANGQLSKSYTDQEGRTIATALLGESPDNVVELGHNVEQENVIWNLDNNDEENRIAHSWVADHTIFNDYSKTYSFSYSLNTAYGRMIYDELGDPVCPGCEYELEISILKPNGEAAALDAAATISPETSMTGIETNGTTTPQIRASYDVACDVSVLDEVVSFDVTFSEVGEYRIRKELKLKIPELDDDLIGDIQTLYGIDNALLDEMIEDYEDLIDLTDCEITLPDVENCVQTCLDATSGNLTDCLDECLDNWDDDIVESECQAMEVQMRLQVSPGGYYFENESGSNNHGFWTEVLASLENDNLKDANGVKMPTTSTIADMQTNWQPSWQDELLTFHPEYCHLQICDDLKEARKFEFALRLIPEWRDVDLNVYTSGQSTRPDIVEEDDPLHDISITSPPGSSCLDLGCLVLEAIDDGYPEQNGQNPTIDLSLEEMVDPFRDITQPNYTNLPTIENHLYDGITNLDDVYAQQWDFYVGMYLTKRNEIINEYYVKDECTHTELQTGDGYLVDGNGDPYDYTVVRDPVIPYNMDDNGSVTVNGLDETDIEGAQCEELCQAYAEYWFDRLNEYNDVAGSITSAHEALIIADLVSYCEDNCENGVVPMVTNDDIANHTDLSNIVSTYYSGGSPTYDYTIDDLYSNAPNELAPCAFCDDRVLFWMNIIEETCPDLDNTDISSLSLTAPPGITNPTVSDHVEYYFEEFCIDHSNVFNENIQITAAMIEDNTTYPHLADIEDILGLAGCGSLYEVVSEESFFTTTCPAPTTCMEALFAYMNEHVLPISGSSLSHTISPTDHYILSTDCWGATHPDPKCDETITKITTSSTNHLLKLGASYDDNLGLYIADQCGTVIDWDDLEEILEVIALPDDVMPVPSIASVTCNNGALSCESVYTGLALQVDLGSNTHTLGCNGYSGTGETKLMVFLYYHKEEQQDLEGTWMCDYPVGFSKDCSSFADIEDDCEQYLLAEAEQLATSAWYGLIQDGIDDYFASLGGCNPAEEFYVTTDIREYHYTLYYYDQAGNLVQTVPPEGVSPLDLTDANHFDQTTGAYKGTAEPDHYLETKYKYNSLEQVVFESNPDEGETEFWYNRAGQLKLSQDARQAVVATGNDEDYSFTHYDALGRIVVVGEITEDGSTAISTDLDDLDILNYPTLSTASGSNSASDLTATWYSGEHKHADFADEHYRNRINAVGYFADYNELDDYKSGTSSDGNMTYYRYDEVGNVDAVIQDIAGFEEKRTDYSFDLVSNNLNEVCYQRDELDQFIHRYDYDADNRVTNVYTSRDGYIWEEDAQYLYLPHGPLARIELGEDKVQGLDHYYTIHGWLKGINMPVAVSSPGNEEMEDLDPGADGSLLAALDPNINVYTSRDEAALTLGYYNGDYTAVDNTNIDFGTSVDDAWTGMDSDLLPASPTTNRPLGLYNGNIAWMITALPELGRQNGNNERVYAGAYQYDQLQRIKQYEGYYSGWVPSAGDPYFDWKTNAYSAEYDYDKNGNILFLKRYIPEALTATVPQYTNPSIKMDDLSYEYSYVNSTELVDNQLDFVWDAAGEVITDFDLDAQGAFNYTYDEIGNLIQDDEEEIEEIKWNVYGKVSEVIRTTSSTDPDLEFLYDARGNRVAKIEKPSTASSSADWIYTYYSLNASGSVMATYTKDPGQIPAIQIEHPQAGKCYEQWEGEWYIYGIGRVGIVSDHYYNEVTCSGTPKDMDIEMKRETGKRSYEIVNHLGNVLVTVNDRRLGQDDGSDNIADYYTAEVLTATDYYPFGSPMPNRQVNSGDYRFGFNGMEMDNEMKGSGNSYDFGARMYDSRLGRWMATDPLSYVYSFSSPYNFASNTPIQAVDPDGRLVVFVNGFMKWHWLRANNYETVSGGTGKYVSGIGMVYDDVPNKNYRPYPTYEMSTEGPTYLDEQFNYWGDIDNEFNKALADYNNVYVDGSDWAASTAKERFDAGLLSGFALVNQIRKENSGIVLESDETIKIVTHSQGAAHGAGMAWALNYAYERGLIDNPVEQIYFLAPHQPADITVPEGIFSVQYSRQTDRVSSIGLISSKAVSGGSSFGRINGVTEFVSIIDKTQSSIFKFGGHFVSSYEVIFDLDSGQFGGVTREPPEEPREERRWNEKHRTPGVKNPRKTGSRR